MSGNSTNLQAIQSNVIDLSPYPPKLRKLGKFMLESDKVLTITEACDELDISSNSIYVSINRCKKKGNDFSKLINDQFQNVLRNNRLRVGKRLIEGVVSDSHMDRKLLFELTGDLKRDIDINVNNTLCIGINTQGVRPSDLEREKGVIDTEVIIPKGK